MDAIIKPIEKMKPFFDKVARNKYLKAIKDGYSKPVKKRGRPPKKNTFNNFPQREYTQYDFESIEKEMIKRTSPDN